MSSIYPGLPDHAPFGHEQKVALAALLPTLKPAQASWLSGFLAGIAGTEGLTASVAAPVVKTAAPAAPAAAPLTILFGSESGNAEKCAKQAAAAASAAGFKPTVVDMGDYAFNKLGDETAVLVIVSTWGEGEPPQRATGFHEFVMGGTAPNLAKLKFAVAGLGDTSYPDFCKCAKDFDGRFEKLGATRLVDRVDLDVDYAAGFKQWLDGAIAAFVAARPKAPAAPSVSVTEAAPAAKSDHGHGHGDGRPGTAKSHPYQARLKERILLNGRGSEKETIHVEIDLGDSGLDYKPGDALGIFPTNAPAVVDETLRLAGYRGDEIVEVDGAHLSLAEVLVRDYDVTGLSKTFLTKYAAAARNGALEAFLKEDDKKKLDEYLYGRELRDCFQDFPTADVLPIATFLGLLRKQSPRLYSIASSIKAHPGEVHLTVGVVRYEAHGRSRGGVCSTFLADRVDLGGSLPVYFHENKNFALPADPKTPIIMVGPGTGIAPFRSFIEERAATGVEGKSWLFFGDQRFGTDYLYQTEWQDYLAKGTLSRIDLAFSRDTDRKVYVQQRMKEKGKELYAWIEEGANFYVCGDAKRMAKDVQQALVEIGVEHGGKTAEQSEAWVKQLQKDKRYQRDVY